MPAEWFGARQAKRTDDTVAVALAASGLLSVGRAVAQGGRLAYSMALAAAEEDPSKVADAYRRLIDDGGIDADVQLQALFFLSSVILRPLLAESENSGSAVLDNLSETLRQFDSFVS